MEQHCGEARYRVDGQGIGGTGRDNPDMEQRNGEARHRVDTRAREARARTITA